MPRGSQRGHGRRSRRFTERSSHTLHERTDEREALERRWFRRMTHEPRLAPLVTGAELRGEPIHRWLAYTQAFSPQLVRSFLSETGIRGRNATVLDPFAGSGTALIECARVGVASRGVEAVPALAFLANVAATGEIPDLPDFGGCERWEDFAARLDAPIHRAALMLAVARQHTTDGRPLRNPKPLPELLELIHRAMRIDLTKPLSAPLRVDVGDARDLSVFSNASIAGVVTSPPYLSRHNYAEINKPLSRVHRFWYEGESAVTSRAHQVRAHPGASADPPSHPASPAVLEVCAALSVRNQEPLAAVVRSYFDDMLRALSECARVVRAGGFVWFVIGGARVRDVYVPSDLLIAEAAAAFGLSVETVRVARRLISAGRKLGGLTNVAPRECVLVMRRSGC